MSNTFLIAVAVCIGSAIYKVVKGNNDLEVVERIVLALVSSVVSVIVVSLLLGLFE